MWKGRRVRERGRRGDQGGGGREERGRVGERGGRREEGWGRGEGGGGRVRGEVFVVFFVVTAENYGFSNRDRLTREVRC